MRKIKGKEKILEKMKRSFKVSVNNLSKEMDNYYMVSSQELYNICYAVELLDDLIQNNPNVLKEVEEDV